MKKQIKIKSTGISIATSILAAVGALSFFVSKNVTAKNLSTILFYSSAVTGIVTAYKTWTDEQEVNEKLTRLLDKADKEVVDANTQLQRVNAKNLELQQSNLDLREKFELKDDEFELLKADDNALKMQLRVAEELVNQKAQELVDFQDSTDTRFQTFLKELILKISVGLDDKIEATYNGLDANCNELLKRPEYEAIHQELAKFQLSLEASHAEHMQLLDELVNFDCSGVTTLVEIKNTGEFVAEQFFRIMSELAALKVRYRNIRNLDERRALDEFQECEQFKITKADAIKNIRELSAHDQTIVEGLKERVNQYGHELSTEYQMLVRDLEKAHESVATLQQQIEKLAQPSTWKFAITHELKAGNLIIEFFRQKGIILDRSHALGDMYRATLHFHIDRNNRAVVAKELNEYSEQVQQYCKAIRPIEFTYDGESGLMIALLCMKTQPQEPPKDKDIYRFVEPSENFSAIIRKYHDHKLNGKPTIRVMGGTGGGKSLITKCIIKAYIEHEENWEIRLSDPMHGSDEDYWEIPKVATDSTSAHKAFKDFVKEFDARSAKSSTHPNQPVLAVFDEFDKQHSDQDKEQAKRVWTAIRHHSMRLILMGQSSQVGANGWQWDDMRNCTLLFIGDAIITATNKYKELGWDLKTKNRIDREYRLISDWMTIKNEELLPENQYRIGLLVCGAVVKFLELPKAVIGSIDKGKSWIVSQPWELSKGNSQLVEPTANSLVNKACPHCGSFEFKKNGKDKATRSIQQYKCSSCGKGFSDLENLANINS